MILRNGTLKEMIKQIANHKLVLYGFGAKAKEICRRLEETGEDICIEVIIDNNPEKQGTCVSIGGCEVPIISKKTFMDYYPTQERIVILFTMENFGDAYEEFETIANLNNIICYIYMLICIEERGSRMYEEGIPKGTLAITDRQLIPKIIHYCWFGKGEYSPLIKRCIESWKKFCPDYEIIRWDESNYDVTKNKYMHDAYKAKKWAYVSDYARIDVVNKYGGVYFDTDVELIRPIDCLLTQKAFAGFELEHQVAFGLGFGSVANNPILESILKLYENLEWDGGTVACPVYQTKVLCDYGLIPNNSFQVLSDMTILPVRCLCGKSLLTRRKWRFKDTYAIHHFAASWVEFTEERIRLNKIYALGEKAIYDEVYE